MKIKSTNLVEKKNILCELRSNNMTLQELRFFSIYLSMINARDPKTRVAHFALSEFQIIMELGRLSINALKTTTDNLLCKIVHVPLGSGGYNSFQLFKKCKVDKDENEEWRVEIDCHDEALPYLFEYQSNYFTYQLWNAIRLKSTNQLQMYELMKQHQKQVKFEISVEKLRERLGIGAKEYPQWERFRTKVLEKCQQALTEHTDIKFTYEPIKRGKGGKVVSLKFAIEKNLDYVDQLTLDEYIDLKPNLELSDDIQATKIEQKQTPELIFENENLEFLSGACDNEFDEVQMAIIKNHLVKLVPFNSKSAETDQYDYLFKKHNELRYRAKRQDLDPLKNRFAYLKSLLEADVKKLGEADEVKW